MRLSSGENVSHLVKHPIIQKHINIVKKMIDDRIFAVFYGEYGFKCEKKFFIEECCDNWFNRYLTVEDCRELAELFTEIADEMERE